MKSFVELTEREILALAISSEEEDGRIYADFGEGLGEDYPDTARVFSDMAAEESEHRRRLIDLYVSKFGSHIPLVRRQDVRGFVQHKKLWQVRPHGVETVRCRRGTWSRTPDGSTSSQLRERQTLPFVSCLAISRWRN